MLKPLLRLQRQVVRTTNFRSILWVNAFPATVDVLVAMDPAHWTVPVVVLVIEIPVELARNLWRVKKCKQHAPLEQLRLGVQLDAKCLGRLVVKKCTTRIRSIKKQSRIEDDRTLELMTPLVFIGESPHSDCICISK